MPLIACPSEIISQIAGNLNKASLSRFALSSRLLNFITTPYLYDHIELRGHSQHWSQPASTEFRNLTVLLLERPHLAGYVRHFTMRKDSSSDGRSRQVEIANLPQALSTAIETASHSKEEERQWLEDVSFTKSINEDALMTLLLPALPNLTTLDLTLGENVTYFSRMMQRASRKEKPFDTTPAFETLSDIMYAQNRRISTYYNEEIEDADRDEEEEEEEEEEHPCYTVMPLSLPAVSRVFGLKSGVQAGVTNQEPWILPLACGFSSQLSHLELRECLLNSQAMVDLLQVPTALKTFIYEVTPMTPISNVLNIDIHRSMEYQMSSLENIWLDYVPWNEGLVRFPQFRYAKPMPSLANFNNLRILRIASPFLFGSIRRLRLEGKGYCDLVAPLLPKRLHTLHLTRHEHNPTFHEEQLESLLVRIPSTTHLDKIIDPINPIFLEIQLESILVRLPYTTHLRKIIIERAYRDIEGWQRSPRVRDLVDLAESKNISLSAVNGGPEHHADDMYDWKGLGIDGSISWTTTALGDNCSFSNRVSDAQSRERRRQAERDKYL